MAAPKAALSLWSITTLSTLLGMGCSSIGLVRGRHRPSGMQQPVRLWSYHEQSVRLSLTLSRDKPVRFAIAETLQGKPSNAPVKIFRRKPLNLRHDNRELPANALRAGDTLLQGPGR
ncbi:hypothetical protein CORC01_11872 [Colletotrichum orchidophilum]|uniref:Uncharacterized protein n=1 Tax=Colletotrichum orchidophilum TaxID=1209926 RepID=A0A1G4AUG8_9PEZI|nr:uncharacterized protein CORC01_11872 [Colletotrichum orchidophilum]OHE92794.1 hypothetical protein CORC01_11872 [Colletotrichum orchidophilum]